MGDVPALDTVEQRVVGSLLEKERTVPATYPLTLNALRSACNQTSGREPVMELDDTDISAAIDRLKLAGVARLVHASHGARVVKYRQVLDERLGLDSAERAVITLLLLRGPQTPGELRSRSERLHDFDELSDVEAALATLAARADPLVVELERRPGQKERRWAHMFGPIVEAPAASAATAPALATMFRWHGAELTQHIAASYDTIASLYADKVAAELDDKPFDRWLVERIAELSAGGSVLDAGCGPGHIAAHLVMSGADASGIDLSPQMIAEARRRFPGVPYAVGDLRDVGAAGGPLFAAIVAWYSLIHLPPNEFAAAVSRLTAAVRAGGWFALAVHIGEGVRHIDDWQGQPVQLDGVFHHPEFVIDAATAAGLTDIEWYRRGPVTDVEVQTERLYLLGRRAD